MKPAVARRAALVIPFLLPAITPADGGEGLLRAAPPRSAGAGEPGSGATQPGSGQPPAGAEAGVAEGLPAAGDQELAPQRDPFRAPEEAEEAARPPGLEGVRITEARVRGVVRLPGARDPDGGSGFAILESPAGEGFVVGPGARLMDGIVYRIQAEGVVFLSADSPETEILRPLSAAESETGEPR